MNKRSLHEFFSLSLVEIVVMKYIFITGGVVSSLGKGLTSGALGALLEQRGLTTRIQKFDPYLNVDPGTMSPFQHGEVYVLDDGAETDLDLGHYERFTSGKLSKFNNLTSGQSTLFKKCTQCTRSKPFTQRRNNATSYKNILHYYNFYQ